LPSSCLGCVTTTTRQIQRVQMNWHDSQGSSKWERRNMI